jgi:predicted phosphohydrolase
MPAVRFFTADLHLGHANIIRYCRRPFSSADDMDEALLAAWEAVVRSDDEVWVLGDLVLGRISETLPLASLLPGRKFLVPGNHDRCWSGHKKGAGKWREEYEAAGFKVVDAPVEVGLAGATSCSTTSPTRATRVRRVVTCRTALPTRAAGSFTATSMSAGASAGAR